MLEKYILKKDSGNVDWGDIWRRVNKVSPQAWTALKEQLKQTYQRVQDIPLLEHAQHPVAVYPDETLKATALERGWEIIGDTPAYP